MSDDIKVLLAMTGLLAQTGAALLMTVLLMLLRQQHRSRSFFYLWCLAWMSLTIALLALVLRYQLPYAKELELAHRDASVVAILYSVYLAGKFAFYLLLIAGALRFAQYETKRTQQLLTIASILLFLVASLLPWYQRDLSMLVWLQAPLACFSGFVSAYLLLNQRRMRSFGTRYCSIMFGAISVLWFLYLMLFPIRDDGTGLITVPFLAAIPLYNSFFDLLLQQLLAFGFVILLLEQGRRETDIAHSKLRRAHEKLQISATQDQVTGAGNRLALYLFTRNDINDCALLSCDLNYLKPINDQYGHEAGDQLLIHFVTVMRQGLRDPDRIYRIGGDEFILIMQGAKSTEALARARALLHQAPPLVWQHHVLRLSASIGAVDWHVGDELHTLLRQADQLMYDDKRAHKASINT